jgi:hypothetical protein
MEFIPFHIKLCFYKNVNIRHVISNNSFVPWLYEGGALELVLKYSGICMDICMYHTFNYIPTQIVTRIMIEKHRKIIWKSKILKEFLLF